MQAVGARQVEHAQQLASGCGQLAFLAFHRDARVIGDFLVAAGEAVEEGSFTAIGVTDQRDQRPGRMDIDN